MLRDGEGVASPEVTLPGARNGLNSTDSKVKEGSADFMKVINDVLAGSYVKVEIIGVILRNSGIM